MGPRSTQRNENHWVCDRVRVAWASWPASVDLRVDVSSGATTGNLWVFNSSGLARTLNPSWSLPVCIVSLPACIVLVIGTRLDPPGGLRTD